MKEPVGFPVLLLGGGNNRDLCNHFEIVKACHWTSCGLIYKKYISVNTIDILYLTVLVMYNDAFCAYRTKSYGQTLKQTKLVN